MSESQPKRAPEPYMVSAVAFHLINFLSALESKAEVRAVNQIAAAWLDENGAGVPDVQSLFAEMREDAAFWADCATPPELEAYVAAGLRRIERTNFCQAATKRLFVVFWECMSATDKRKFLARVDAEGKFLRRAS